MPAFKVRYFWKRWNEGKGKPLGSIYEALGLPKYENIDNASNVISAERAVF